MTRINTIHPSHLSNKHLVAAWNETPRIITLVEKRIAKNPKDPISANEIPDYYTLGRGHCLFFYNKLFYIIDYIAAIKTEMQLRRMKPNHILFRNYEVRIYTIFLNYDNSLFIPYEPSTQDKLLNLNRLIERSPDHVPYLELKHIYLERLNLETNKSSPLPNGASL